MGRIAVHSKWATYTRSSPEQNVTAASGQPGEARGSQPEAMVRRCTSPPRTKEHRVSEILAHCAFGSGERIIMERSPIMRRFLFLLAFLSAAALAQDKAAETLNAVVGISAKIQKDARSADTLGLQRSGSGAIVRDGYVLTIGYLVIEAEAVQVTGADGRTLPATVAAYDHASGFALLKVIGSMPAKPLALGDSAALGERDPAMAVSASSRDAPAIVYVVSRRAFSGNWEYLLDSAIFTYP